MELDGFIESLRVSPRRERRFFSNDIPLSLVFAGEDWGEGSGINLMSLVGSVSTLHADIIIYYVTDAIPLRVRKEIEACARDLGDCHGTISYSRASWTASHIYCPKTTESAYVQYKSSSSAEVAGLPFRRKFSNRTCSTVCRASRPPINEHE